MELARECIKSYPKRPSEKDIRMATEKERISKLAQIYAKQKKEEKEKKERVKAQQAMVVEKLL